MNGRCFDKVIERLRRIAAALSTRRIERHGKLNSKASVAVNPMKRLRAALPGPQSSRFRFLKERRQVLFPDHCHSVSAVTAGLLAQWNQNRPPLFYFLDHEFQDAELGRVDQIIRGIHGHERGLDSLQAGSGIVIAGAIERVENVIGIECLQCSRNALIKCTIRIHDRRRTGSRMAWACTASWRISRTRRYSSGSARRE